ncbi:MAG: AfsR/SARP family transcriptional regulator [Acidimicrobiia bacterium]|nr:AfsR/SARP family transcriptional regulator [Acidimicrobiia bacterium]
MEPCRYLVLGPMLVRTPEGQLEAPGGPVTRAVLAALLIAANHAVSQDLLIEETWGDGAPHDPEHSLHSQVTRLRRLLGPEAITRSGRSYTLTVADDSIDAMRFENLAGQASDAEDADTTRALCLEGLELWRGAPFGDLADRDFLRLETYRLEEIRLNVIETCFDADLELGRHQEIVASLRAAVTQYPFRETLWGQLVTALGRSGRQPEGLRVYDEYASFLRSELGIQPGVAMQRLRDGIVADRAQPTA